ncbi:hypothetical protein OIHEL45_20001 [Sulfitobacter indolifex HEL-45]|uniref:Uncharacterized protein n=1 Tax=Sulfitobacter indolifex HEL-45 TaxID=391624 RepID=A0ABP2D3W1_9RHOB|nr:hypothetical protein OIHEL45_20001 [Sulfitobacter indolifex HEL-45]
MLAYVDTADCKHGSSIYPAQTLLSFGPPATRVPRETRSAAEGFAQTSV